MRVLQINSVFRRGSTGRIVEALRRTLESRGHVAMVAYGRGTSFQAPLVRRFGSAFDVGIHGAATRLLDAHGFGSRHATQRFIEYLRQARPDVVHLHNLHGYYLNVEVLFEFLREARIPVLWTLHDCWGFTGHCAHFDMVGCRKWVSRCFRCPQTARYPASWLVDRSGVNFDRKRRAFRGLPKLTLVVPSAWLAGLVAESFLSSYAIRIVPNGVDVGAFAPRDSESVRASLKIRKGASVVLAVAADFRDERKGARYLLELARGLPPEIVCLVVGMPPRSRVEWPRNVIWTATNDVGELASLYSLSSVFVNPTLEDTFPTVNLEALACGTPVVAFSTGGCPEQVDLSTGATVARGDSAALVQCVMQVLARGKPEFASACRARALRFSDVAMCNEYLRLYEAVSGAAGLHGADTPDHAACE